MSGIPKRRLKRIGGNREWRGESGEGILEPVSICNLLQHSPGFLDRLPGWIPHPTLPSYTLVQFSQLDLRVNPGFNFPPISPGRSGAKICPKIFFASSIFVKLNRKGLQDSFLHSAYSAKHSSQLFIRWQSPQEPSLLGPKASFKFLWQRFIGWQFWFQAMFWPPECGMRWWARQTKFLVSCRPAKASEEGQWLRSFQLVLWAKRKMVG